MSAEAKPDVWVLGVDPGLSGALAFYNPITKELVVRDMPLECDHNPKAPRKIDLPRLALLVGGYSKQTLFATIEEVHSMPKQGVVSTFNFGYAAGVIAGMVSASLIPIKFVRPEIWKRLMNLSSDKSRSLALARSKFPTHATTTFKRKMDDGRAEAALLAYFGSERFINRGAISSNG